MSDKRCYYLEFADPRMDFHLAIPREADGASASPRVSIPDWAKLKCCQCANCPLTCEDAECCPPAYDMIELVEHFSMFNSYDRVNLHMWTNSMMHTIRTDLQRALAYLYPAMLAESACPYAALLLPMTKFGKPFPDMADFSFYALAFGLIHGYLHADKPNRADGAALDSSRAFSVAQVLHGLLLRIRRTALSDANINALVKDIQWSYVTMHPHEFFKSQLEKYFV